MLLVEATFLLLPFFNLNLIKAPNLFFGKKNSAFAFKTTAFNYAVLFNQTFHNNFTLFTENIISYKTIKKTRKFRRWAPASILHLTIATICIAASPTSARLRPAVQPGLLFFASILGCWWTAIKAPYRLSWSWDPIECALLLNIIVGICATHTSGRICNSSTRSYIFSIAPRLVRGGLLRTGHHAKFNSSKKSCMFESTEYFNYAIRYNKPLLAFSLFFIKNKILVPQIIYLNLNKNWKMLGPTVNTHITILMSVMMVGWYSWPQNNLLLGGLFFRV